MFNINTTMTKIINIENKNQLLAAKYEHERLIFLISGGFCKPCQVLKPNLHTLLENNDNYGIVLAKITYETAKDMKHETAKEMNEYFDLKKIPFLVCYNDTKKIDSLQSSKIDLVKPFLEKSFGIEMIYPQPEEEESNDEFMAFDF